MKVTGVSIGALAAVSAIAMASGGDKQTGDGITTTITTTTGTHKAGKFNKTSPSEEPTTSGTHKYGRFDKTSPSEEPTSTGTHKYGKFNKTSPSEEPTSTGTHKYGKFNKTSPSEEPTSTGTHKYGKFNKTSNPTSTVYAKDAAVNAAPSDFDGAHKVLGLTVGSAALVGALMLL
ncbi:LADA_0E06326g1_1 [Lachancea dasiensis]|uniref:LADA_0E06326g1_1 n=1 Tax=Lachancea dasiensis TaxID=1072105 RepID=A0A1G4JCH3_9SACH|nr:LADA_0E06326g1_1 [Lachancea dasiensis]